MLLQDGRYTLPNYPIGLIRLKITATQPAIGEEVRFAILRHFRNARLRMLDECAAPTLIEENTLPL